MFFMINKFKKKVKNVTKLNITIMRNTAYGRYCLWINSYIITRWYLKAFVFDFWSLWCSCNEKSEKNSFYIVFKIETAFETEATGRHAWEAYFMFKKREKFNRQRSNVRETFGIFILEFQMPGRGACIKDENEMRQIGCNIECWSFPPLKRKFLYYFDYCI